jgi:hypothetical protein
MGFLLFILMLSTSEPTNWYFLAAWLFYVLIHECREG